MANQYVNKVDLADGTTLIDLTSDTVAADKMLYGYTAHGADGAQVTGSIGTGAAEVSGTNTVTPYANLEFGQGIYYQSSDNGISVTAIGGGAASASVSAVSTTAGYIAANETLDTETVSVSQTTTQKTRYINALAVPKAQNFQLTVNDGDPNDVSIVTIINGFRRRVAEYNYGGYVNYSHSSASGSLYVYPYVSSGSSPQITIISNGSLNSATAAVTGTNTVTPSAALSGTNVSFSTASNGIPVVATGGGTASVTATATANKTGVAMNNDTLGSATLNASSSTTTETKYLTGVTVPSSTDFSVANSGSLAVTNASGSDIVINLAGDITIGSTQVVDDGAWVTTNVTQAGTYYGKVVVPDPATLVYTVGSFWATEDSTKNPTTELGFGTWTKVSPIEATWNRLKQTTTWAEMAMDAPTVYVWKRTA